MAITDMGSKAAQSLAEYCVGEATDTCLYPGIGQCFAVAGVTQGKILGVHVSPGFSDSDMDAAFGLLKAKGGDQVMYWYIVGPFVDHFGVRTAKWRSAKDIKKTFRKYFRNDAASHLILDASDERNSMVAVPGSTIMSKFQAIDIRVTVRGITTAFAYKETRRSVTSWTEFDLTKFRKY